MKKLIALALAMALIIPTLSCASEKAKEEVKQEQQAAVKKPDAPTTPKEPTLQELQAQRTAIALRLEGAEVSKKAIERIILDGQVSLSKLDEMIASKAPRKEEAKK